MDMMKARDGSLLSKYGAAIILIVGTVLVGLKKLPGLTAWDVVVAAFALAALFGTVDLNLILEKIFGRKDGGK